MMIKLRRMAGIVLALSLLLPAGALAACKEGSHDLQLLQAMADASCTESGYGYYACRKCPVRITLISPALGHDNTVTDSRDATCAEEGYVATLCSRCGETHTEVIPTVAHDFALTGHADATCALPGQQLLTCRACGAGDSIPVDSEPATGEHLWIPSREVPSTCTGEGMLYLTCSTCGAETSDVLPPNGHEYEEYQRDEATCVDSGMSYSSCIACGDARTDVLPPTGDHPWAENRTLEPTCIQPGAAIVTCTVCGLVQDAVLPALGHDDHETGRVEPTCEADGVRYTKCTVCGNESSTVLPATGHTWITEVIQEPACAAEGASHSVCTVCQAEKTDVIPATGLHSWVDHQILAASTCLEEGTMETICETCSGLNSRSMPLGGHHYEKWHVTAEASADALGERTRTCTVCGHAQTASFAMPTTATVVTTTAHQVNLRKNPGLDQRRVSTVARNTQMGPLLATALDEDGVVWYKVKYRNNPEAWISSAYAKVEVLNYRADEDRVPQGDSTEIAPYCMTSLLLAAEGLGLGDVTAMGERRMAVADGLLISGVYHLDTVSLTGGSWTLYGARPGMHMSDADSALRSSGLVKSAADDHTVTYAVPATPLSMAITTDGYGATLELHTDGAGMVTEISWTALKP